MVMPCEMWSFMLNVIYVVWCSEMDFDFWYWKDFMIIDGSIRWFVIKGSWMVLLCKDFFYDFVVWRIFMILGFIYEFKKFYNLSWFLKEEVFYDFVFYLLNEEIYWISCWFGYWGSFTNSLLNCYWKSFIILLSKGVLWIYEMRFQILLIWKRLRLIVIWEGFDGFLIGVDFRT